MFTAPVHSDLQGDSKEAPGRLQGFAAWALSGPLTLALAVLAIAQLTTWIPHYLTWPWWPDQDLFATMALGWERGKLPYRDVISNNFPGQIYLMWGLGKAFGWGRTMPFQAADATLVVALGPIMLIWSRRCFSWLLPGLVGYLAFLSYYLSLDYTQVGQRDWQGPFFVVAAILLVQAWPTRVARLASAAATAVAITFRPQVVLFLPALALAMDEGVRRPDEGAGKLVRPLLEWSLAFAACIGLAFAPLATAGVFDDFLDKVREVGYGGSYNLLTPASLVKKFLSQKPLMQVLATPVLMAILGGQAGARVRRLARTWTVAVVSVGFYMPLSPISHDYLYHPLWLVLAIVAAVLVKLLILEAPRANPALQLAGVLLVLAPAVMIRPPFCVPAALGRSWGAIRSGRDPSWPPPGYVQHPSISFSADLRWSDYCATLDYLRRSTSPSTFVANALLDFPAINGPTARLSVYPADSTLAWLLIHRDADDSKFAEALEREPDSVVVWDPRKWVNTELNVHRLEEVIRRHYRLDAKFGEIEVWRRANDTPGDRGPKSSPDPLPAHGRPP